MKDVDVKELKKMINLAEEELEKLKEDDRRRFKQRRITKALEKAYALLNKKEYTQNEVDKRTRDVWRSLQDGIPFIWFFLIGILLTGTLVFTAYESYSFIQANWDRNHFPWWPPQYDLTDLVSVNYEETNIVSMYDMITVSDTVGLKNKPEVFNISNDASKLPNVVDYNLAYNVNIQELNKRGGKILDKRYIKYRVTYEDINGNEVISNIGRLSDLKRNPDGTYLLVSGMQRKNAKTNFKVVFWLSDDATNNEQGATFTLMFRVVAVLMRTNS